MAGFFHQMSFPDWRWNSVKGVLLSAAILFVLYKSSSWQRFAVFVLIDWLSLAWEFPLHPNHIVFTWFVDGTLLTSLAIVAVKNKKNPEVSLESKWYAAFAPWIRIELCVLYFFTVFHKLNYSYFDIDWSCAAKLHMEIYQRFPVLPQADWALYSAVYGTLIIETAIPLLLLFRRTRMLGVILGVSFHAMLSLHPHMGLISFTSMMTALFTTFLPLSTAIALKPGDKIRKAWRWGLFALGALLLIWSLRGLLPSSLHLEEKIAQAWKAGFITYYIYIAFGLAIFIRSQKISGIIGNGIQSMQGSWRSHPVLAVFILLLMINGFGPYFGLRTQTSFSMFSNLHTEIGESNHLIMPSGIQFTNWQYDVVEIVDSNEPDLIWAKNNSFLVIYLEMRRMRTSARDDFWVTFRRNGKEESFDMKRPETYSTIQPLNALGKRYFFFRHVEQDAMKVKCQQ